jgi:hypothetical protein
LRHRTVYSFRWIIMAENTVCWFIMREKYCWMTADSAEPAKRIGWKFLDSYVFSFWIMLSIFGLFLVFLYKVLGKKYCIQDCILFFRFLCSLYRHYFNIHRSASKKKLTTNIFIINSNVLRGSLHCSSLQRV